MTRGLSRSATTRRAAALRARPRPLAGPDVGGRRIWVTAVVTAVLFTLYGTPQAAWAHNALIGTTPVAGTQVEVAPATVVLTFNEPAVNTGTKVLVTGPDGLATVGDPVLVDNTVRQDLKAGLPAGDYTVEWRVTSADGHPISGSFSFRAKAGSAGDLPTTVGPSATAEGPSATPTTTGNDEPAQRSGWLWLLAVVPIGLAAALGWRFSRR